MSDSNSQTRVRIPDRSRRDSAAAPLVDAVDRTIDPTIKPARLLSLDVYRGLVIFAMLIVNNIAAERAGYFWSHADWVYPWLAESFSQWWHGLRSGALPLHAVFTEFPPFRHCTLADYVMPSFMLIIGLAIPYSVASSKAKAIPAQTMWVRTIRRTFLLIVLGWILVYFRDQFIPWFYSNPHRPFTMSLGMDVLQLLGCGYLVARIAYELPRYPRLALAMALLIWHWAFLRFYPQGELPAGTFGEFRDFSGHLVERSAVQYAYNHWPIWEAITWHLGAVTFGWKGLLSVPPAAATMILGTVAGDWIRRSDVKDPRKVRNLAIAGAITALIGFAWAFDLPFNKPRWTPCYLLWVSGVGFMIIALFYWIVDMNKLRVWTYPFVVLGANSIAAYFLSIMGKILFLNTPRVTLADGTRIALGNYCIAALKSGFGGWAGGWMFTILFVAFWWVVLDQMYRRKIFWKL